MTHPDPTYRFEFEVSKVDYRTLIASILPRYRLENGFLAECRAIQRRLNWLAGLSLFFCAWAWLITVDSDPDVAPFALTFSVATAVVLWKRWANRGEVLLRQRIEDATLQAVDNPNFPRYLGPVTLVIGAEGLRSTTLHEATLSRWPDFKELVDTPDALYLTHLDGRITLLPARAFPSPAERAACTADIRAWMLTFAVDSDPWRVVRFLNTHDLPCPGCAYPLGGVIDARCPECGLFLDRDAVPGAWIQKPTADHAPSTTG